MAKGKLITKSELGLERAVHDFFAQGEFGNKEKDND